MGRIRCGKNSWVVGIYINGNMEEKLEVLKRKNGWKKRGRDKDINRDFNKRIEMWGEWIEVEELKAERNLKDKKVNERRKLIEFISERRQF